MILRPNIGEYSPEPRWHHSPRLAQWLRAAPAILAILACLGVVVVYFKRDPARLETLYIHLADQALASENYDQARVASERLLMLDSHERPAHVLRLGKSLAGLGRIQMAVNVVSQMADTATPENIPAHLFIAQAVLHQSVVDAYLNPHLRAAEQHLRQVLAVDSNSLEAQALLGEYYFQIGDRAQAKRQLAQLYPQRNQVALPLCAVALAEGNHAEASHWAEAAARHYQREAQSHPEDYELRVKWAQAENILGHSDQALAILDEGLKKSDQPAYRQLAANLLAARMLEFARQSPRDLVGRMELIRRGVQYDPRNELLIMQLVRLADQEKDEQGPAHRCLKDLESVGANCTVIEFCRGMFAWEKHDLGTAVKYLNDAYVRDPDNGIVANNLADFLATSNPPQPKRALELIDRVLLTFPDTPMFRETRGRILILLGRWTEAAQDLEFAARFYVNSASLHSALADVYTQLKAAELSAKHRRQAEEIRARQK